MFRKLSFTLVLVALSASPSFGCDLFSNLFGRSVTRSETVMTTTMAPVQSGLVIGSAPMVYQQQQYAIAAQPQYTIAATPAPSYAIARQAAPVAPQCDLPPPPPVAAAPMPQPQLTYQVQAAPVYYTQPTVAYTIPVASYSYTAYSLPVGIETTTRVKTRLRTPRCL